MTVNPSMTLRSTAALVFICGAALASLNAQEAPSERSEAGEFQKLDPALKFLRIRNARDYAVTSPNGIDEAVRYLLVETLVGFLFLGAFLLDVLAGSRGDWGISPTQLVAAAYHAVFLALLVAATFID